MPPPYWEIVTSIADFSSLNPRDPRGGGGGGGGKGGGGGGKVKSGSSSKSTNIAVTGQYAGVGGARLLLPIWAIVTIVLGSLFIIAFISALIYYYRKGKTSGRVEVG